MSCLKMSLSAFLFSPGISSGQIMCHVLKVMQCKSFGHAFFLICISMLVRERERERDRCMSDVSRMKKDISVGSWADKGDLRPVCAQ